MSDGIDLGYFSLAVGFALFFVPEPATTTFGLTIIGATFGLAALSPDN